MVFLFPFGPGKEKAAEESEGMSYCGVSYSVSGTELNTLPGLPYSDLWREAYYHILQLEN